MIKQYRYIMALMNIFAHANILRSKLRGINPEEIKEFSTYLGDNESLLDRDYKHVAEKIALHWGYEEFYAFVGKLSSHNRTQSRNGLPFEVIQELNELSEIHDRLFPEKRKTIRNTTILR